MDRAALGRVLERAHETLAGLPGVTGLALGGSQATGTATAESDIDIGLYYSRDNLPSLSELSAALGSLDDRGQPDAVAGYGEWGPWVNGGSWLRVNGEKVDVLLREIERVEDVVNECVAGQPQIFYQVGHPHGFSTVIYVGEVHHNVPFHDPDGTLVRLKALTEPYPVALAKAIVASFGWEAGFALDNAAGGARRADATYVCGCLYRAAACLTQVLFAVNGRYLRNEKGAVAIADGFPLAPQGFRARIDEALGLVRADPGALGEAIDAVCALRDEVMAIADRG